MPDIKSLARRLHTCPRGIFGSRIVSVDEFSVGVCRHDHQELRMSHWFAYRPTDSGAWFMFDVREWDFHFRGSHDLFDAARVVAWNFPLLERRREKIEAQGLTCWPKQTKPRRSKPVSDNGRGPF